MTTRITDASNFLDVNGLNDIRLQSKSADKSDKKDALEKVAKQFESLFMQMLLKSMRKAQEVLESDSPFNSQSTKFYRDMHDQQLAVELSEKGSLGLAPLIVRQLGGDSEHFTPKSVLRNDASLATAKHNLAVNNVSAAESTNNLKVNSLQTEQNTNNVIAKKVVKPAFEQPQDFVRALTIPAKQVQRQLGIPFEVVIAQAALETGWGQKIIKTAQGTSSNNLFNIKADARWQGEKTDKETLEFTQGSMVKTTAPFRVYQSINDSVNDFVNFISSNERYQGALQQAENVEQFLHGLQQAGYATDPNYATKILATLNKVVALLNN